MYTWKTTIILVIIAVTATLLIFAETERDGQNIFISRKNLGYTLEKVGRIQLTSGRLRLLFKYNVPVMRQPRPMQDYQCAEYTNLAAKRSCLHFRGVVVNLFELKNDMLRLMNMRWEEINELLIDLQKTS